MWSFFPSYNAHRRHNLENDNGMESTHVNQTSPAGALEQRPLPMRVVTSENTKGLVEVIKNYCVLATVIPINHARAQGHFLVNVWDSCLKVLTGLFNFGKLENNMPEICICRLMNFGWREAD